MSSTKPEKLYVSQRYMERTRNKLLQNKKHTDMKLASIAAPTIKSPEFLNTTTSFIWKEP